MNFKFNLKTKLVLIFIGVLLASSLIINYLFISHNTECIEQNVFRKNMSLAKGLKSQIKITINDMEAVMRSLVDTKNVKNMESNDYLDSLLKGIAEEYPVISQLYIMDRNGRQIYKTSGSLGNRADREYFQKAIQGKTYFSKAIISRSQGTPIIVLAIPIKKNGEIVGVMGANLDLTYLNRLASKTKPGKTGYGYIVDRDGRLIGHPDSQLVNNRYDASNLLPVKKVMQGQSGTDRYTFKGEKKLASYTPIEETGWGVVVQLTSQEAFSQIDQEKEFALMIVLVSGLAAIGIALLLAKYITDPINKSMNFAREIAQGRLNVEDLNITSQDEFGKLMEALNEMKNNLKTVIENLVDTSEDLSAYSQELSASAEEGNAIIEENTESVEQMATSIQQISASSQEVTGLAQEASSKAQLGSDKVKEMTNIQEFREAVNKTVEDINELDTNSEEISKIVALITNIAEQTNMLALNAAIEAARAGEHGEGFAVVAEEIRELAEETTKATGEIKELVATTQDKSKESLEAVKEVQNKVENRKEVLEETNEVFSEIKAAIENTSAHIQQTAAATQELAENSDQIENTSHDMENMSHEITNSSQELANMAQKLHDLIEEFKI
ncbi:methyl-accepting chemotaxis protein [Sporohalobacter salinus]|uniref:methyl-accepting chemotaxis protein n=1 Tax=Sporohalobacter salinus TaxID=1494606 RepID=UPI001960AF15|nr:methyl-accepting chemotaxis protein [Sporohalobacter salinus]MBM7623340.1 methyl-accepting chemotaxis protein [Sporohalobacter salinus]